MREIPVALELLFPIEKTLSPFNAGKNRQNTWQLKNRDVMCGYDDFRHRICRVARECRFRSSSLADQDSSIFHVATGTTRKPMLTSRVATTSVLETL